MKNETISMILESLENRINELKEYSGDDNEAVIELKDFLDHVVDQHGDGVERRSIKIVEKKFTELQIDIGNDFTGNVENNHEVWEYAISTDQVPKGITIGCVTDIHGVPD